MEWEVEYTDQFEGWFDALTDDEQASVAAKVDLLAAAGPHLGFPHSSNIRGSRHGEMRELRIQHQGHPYRVLYAFDPRRCAILLLGGEKTGDDRWYVRNVAQADQLYDEHLETLKREAQ